MTLHAALRCVLGALELDVRLDVEDGEVLAVLGPNGAGKTTLLRCLAGLQPIDAGRIELDGATLDDPEQGVFVPPERRSIGMVFQQYALFAHLCAVDNVAFGLRARGVAKARAHETAHRLLAQVGLDGVARHRPHQLSGGQAQRVALARALATSPHLLLLDEPLAALDVATRAELRHDLQHHLRSFRGARLLVTHDLADAAALADRVAVLEHGQLVQVGTVRALVEAPATGYVAALVNGSVVGGTG